jgi:serine/threonine protein kinase
MEINEHANQRVGMVLNQKYTLHRLIGSGGMASVYEASHRNGHRVAIKILHPHLAERADVCGRFLREGYVANRVEHPGAVRVLDDDVAEDGSVFLVMELLSGTTLDERCKQAGGLLPVREVCDLAYRLLEVLAAAHEKGVVHRDIKPENLFLTDDGALKVLDFGIARLLENTELHSATKTGVMLGTPAFMAPEQALGHSSDVDGQTDLWAVGATMFALMTGKFVHDAETLEEMMVRAGSMQARRVRSVADHVPPPIAAVVDTAVAFHKVDRWADAWDMSSRLYDAYLFSFGDPILPQSTAFRPAPLPPAAPPAASIRPRPLGPTSGPARTIARLAPRSAPPLSTTIGSSRERPRRPRRSSIPAYALVLFALGSVIAGIVVASRKEPAAAVVSRVPPPPHLLIPAPPPSAIPAEEILAPQPSAASGSADAEAVRLDAGGVDAASSSAVVSSAKSPAAALRQAPAPVQPEYVPAARPVEAPPAMVAASPVATAPAAPSVTAAAAPSATDPAADAPAPSARPSPEPTYDPVFGL